MKDNIDWILDWCDINLMKNGFLVLCCTGIVMGLLLFTYIDAYKEEEFYLDWALEDPVTLDPIRKKEVIEKEKKKHTIIMFILIPAFVYLTRIYMCGHFSLCLLFLFIYWCFVYISHILWNKWFYRQWKKKKKW